MSHEPNNPLDTGSRLTISLTFCFKGETYTPRTTIDLDALMEAAGELPCFYNYLAEVSHISPYSYEHDVMMMEELEFESAEGLAANHLHGDTFDSEAFQAAWHEQKLLANLQAIAARHMGVDDLPAQPQLQQALVAAYRLGRHEPRHEQHSHVESVF
jgi:hypothetical protein